MASPSQFLIDFFQTATYDDCVYLTNPDTSNVALTDLVLCYVGVCDPAMPGHTQVFRDSAVDELMNSMNLNKRKAFMIDISADADYPMHGGTRPTTTVIRK